MTLQFDDVTVKTIYYRRCSSLVLFQSGTQSPSCLPHVIMIVVSTLYMIDHTTSLKGWGLTLHVWKLFSEVVERLMVKIDSMLFKHQQSFICTHSCSGRIRIRILQVVCICNFIYCECKQIKLLSSSVYWLISQSITFYLYNINSPFLI